MCNKVTISIQNKLENKIGEVISFSKSRLISYDDRTNYNDSVLEKRRGESSAVSQFHKD
jgi:hypothetical protein